MPLGREIGLGPGLIVLDGDPAKKRSQQPRHFSTHAYCGQTVAHLSYYELLYMLPTRASIDGMCHVCFYSQPHSITALWPVFQWRTQDFIFFGGGHKFN